jgi:hypothetical protein
MKISVCSLTLELNQFLGIFPIDKAKMSDQNDFPKKTFSPRELQVVKFWIRKGEKQMFPRVSMTSGRSRQWQSG